MSYRRGNFGIEYRPEGPHEETPWLLWAIGLAIAVALVYWVKVGCVRLFEWIFEEPAAVVQAQSPAVSNVNAVVQIVQSPLKVQGKRPRRLENLLMRLDRAVATTNVALQVATIEEIRSLPGAPAADLDDDLAQRLGTLKMHMLFGVGMHNEWVKTIKVKRGNSASRIASEYGTTLKCVEKLNGDVSSLKVGQSLKVMNHPQFRLSVYRKTGVADLYLNGRFFKRYYLVGPIGGEDGSYTFTANTRALLSAQGVKFLVKDVAELEMLLPKGANMTIADFR